MTCLGYNMDLVKSEINKYPTGGNKSLYELIKEFEEFQVPIIKKGKNSLILFLNNIFKIKR